MPLPDRALRLIALDASPAGEGVSARVGALEDGRLIASTAAPGHEGIAALPRLVEDCLQQAGWTTPDLVAVVIGPGSFTGLRTACAFAAGLALGADCPVIGVTRGEALAVPLRARVAAESLSGWCSITVARRGRWFVETDSPASGPLMEVTAVESDTWTPGAGSWLLAGDAAADLHARQPGQVLLSGLTDPRFEDIAAVARARQEGRLPPRPSLPLYVDAPEAKLPRGGLRAAPQ